jgi:hypothetical protein
MGINPGFRFVKILDIGYTTLLYFVLAIVIASLMDILYGKYDTEREKQKSVTRKTLDLVGMIWLNGIIIYVVRNIAALIPSPFNGLYGFQHNRLKELDSAYVFDFVLIYNQPNLVKRMQILFHNIKAFILKYNY